MNPSALLTEIRQAVRSLARRPAFAATVILTLGLGIGAISTIYSVVDAMIVRPLSYSEAERMVAIGTVFPGREWMDDARGLQHLAGSSVPNFIDWQTRSHSFESMAAVELRTVLEPGDEGNELVRLGMASEGFLELFGGQPVLGRLFSKDEYSGSTDTPVLISYGAWVRRYGADPDAIGQPALGSNSTIIGILPAEFRPPETLGRNEIEYWSPLNPDDLRYADRGRRSAWIFGRLRPGVSVEAARAELRAVQTQVSVEFPDGNVYPDGKHFDAGVNNLQAQIVGGKGRTVWIFFTAALLLLLIAGLNAANLLFVRGLDHEGEMSIRKALGAGRGRLIARVLVDALLLALAAGVLGIALAFAGVESFLRFAPASLPRLADVSVNTRILAASLAVTLGTGFLVGLFPALRLSRRNLILTIKRTGGKSTESIRLRRLAVVLQLSMAFVLCVGASLLVHSYACLATVDPGFRPDRLSAFSMGMKRPGAESVPLWQQWDELRGYVESIPGLDGVAMSSNVPLQSPNWAPWVRLDDDPPQFRRTGVAGYVITPDYFEVAGIRIEEGRSFRESDGPNAVPVGIVNRAFVQSHLQGRNAIGTTFRTRSDQDADIVIVIVGVVADVVQTTVEEGFLPAVYLPYTQTEWPAVQVLLRSDRTPASLSEELRKSLNRFSPVPIRGLASMNERIWQSQTSPRFAMFLIACLGTVAILLSGVGLYAAMAHSVGRRSRELGIRMAIGADRNRIFRMVLGEGAIVAAVGLGIGWIGALILTRHLQRFLFSIDVLDPLTFIAATGVLAMVIFAAVLRPARAATRVDLVDSLKAF